MTVSFTLNGQAASFDADPQMPLLWVIREMAGLTGTKFGCGVAACGACSVHFNGEVVRSCVLPVSAVEGANITTIEGLAASGGLPDGTLHPIQKAWIEVQVPQCGYCQSGMMMATAALLKKTPHPTEAQVAQVITNICRCGTYPRVKQAIAGLTGGLTDSIQPASAGSST